MSSPRVIHSEERVRNVHKNNQIIRWGGGGVARGTTKYMVTLWTGNIFRVTGPLWGKSTGHRSFPLQKASDAGLCCIFNLRLSKRLSNHRDAGDCPASRTTLVATRFRVAVICPIIQVPHCIRVFFYFVWFVFINHIFQFYYELCTYCNILDIYLS